MMQSAAAAFAANARDDISSSSGVWSDDSSEAMELFESDSNVEDFFVSPLESNEQECT